MTGILAELDQKYIALGLLPLGVIAVALIMNVSSLRGKDMNHKSGHAANLLFIALLIESGAWMARAFGGGTAAGAFWAIASAACLHVLSAALALRAFWEHATIGRWPYGRRRAVWSFWLNVAALLCIAAWFYLCLNPKLYRRIFE